MSTDDFININDELTNIISMGGDVVLILMVMGLFSFVLFVFKIIQFSWMGVWNDDACHDNVRHPMYDALQHAKQGDATDQQIESMALSGINTLNNGMGTLSLIASLSTLLGLLGTVLGMIDAFQSLAMTTGAIEPAILAGGIWKALSTTAAGLIVALLALILHHILNTIINIKTRRYDFILNQYLAK